MDPLVTAHAATWLAGLIVTGFVGLLTKRYHELLEENKSRDSKREHLEREFRQHLASLPLVYVAKTDYHRDIDEIKDILKDIRSEVKQHGR